MFTRLWAALGRLVESLLGFADAVDAVSATIRQANARARPHLEVPAAEEPHYLPEPSANGVHHPEPQPTTVGLPEPSRNRGSRRNA
jgi:hypothetical protein